MGYTLDKVLSGVDMAKAEEVTRAGLMARGFGVLTEIDVSATMKKKIDVDMPGYKILGACNPKLAFEAIGVEAKIGAMLPCNVILRQVDGGIEVSAIDPVVSMSGVENADLPALAGQVRTMLQEVIEAL